MVGWISIGPKRSSQYRPQLRIAPEQGGQAGTSAEMYLHAASVGCTCGGRRDDDDAAGRAGSWCPAVDPISAGRWTSCTTRSAVGGSSDCSTCSTTARASACASKCRRASAERTSPECWNDCAKAAPCPSAFAVTGPEFVSEAVQSWARRRGITWHCIEPIRTQQLAPRSKEIFADVKQFGASPLRSRQGARSASNPAGNIDRQP